MLTHPITQSLHAALLRSCAPQRFVSQKLHDAHPTRNLDRVKATAGGQKPFAAFLSCADSRVPVEIIFDQGWVRAWEGKHGRGAGSQAKPAQRTWGPAHHPTAWAPSPHLHLYPHLNHVPPPHGRFGDVFVTRVAGNIVTHEITASLEFGTAVLGSKVLMVLGHSACGAVAATQAGAAVPGVISSLYYRCVRVCVSVWGGGLGLPVGCAFAWLPSLSLMMTVHWRELAATHLSDTSTHG